jgi:hypothetical protein
MDPHGVELNALERFFFNVHDQCRGTGTFTFATRFDGRVDPVVLERVLAALQQRHPLLRAAVQRDGRRMTFVCPTSYPPIPVEWIETDDADRWSTEVVTCSRVMFDDSMPPLVRIRMLQDRQHHWCDMLLTAHHGVVDGRSLAVLMREMQELWSAAQTGAPAVSLQDWALMQVSRPARQRGVLGQLWSRWRSRWESRLYREPTFHRAQAPSPACRREVLTAEMTGSLLSRCRQEQSSMNGALTAAILHTLSAASELQNCRFRLESPVDVRAYCDPPVKSDQVGNYVWAAGYRIAAPEQMPFWELARRCRAELETGWDPDQFRLSWHRLPWIERFVRPRMAVALRQRSRKMLIGVNNLGVLPAAPEGTDFALQELSWYVHREYSTPMFEIGLNAATVVSRLNLSFNSLWHTPEELARLSADFRQQLERAVSP